MYFNYVAIVFASVQCSYIGALKTAVVPMMDRIHFTINDAPHSVGAEVTSDLTLLDYIRDHAELRGTKYMCREGGCGLCIVSAVVQPNGPPISVNSCLVSVTSCQGWKITTIEEVGNRSKGYDIIQTTLAENNGTQCGYCTPGWVMAMYNLLHSNKGLTKLEIEKSLGSNVCRCTGYRSILEAFKKFAIDHEQSVKVADIEDLDKPHCSESCSKKNCIKSDWCFISKDEVKDNNNICIHLKDGKKWFKVYTVRDIFDILNREGDDSYMLVAGNTAKGAYPIYEYPQVLIDISNVYELKGYIVDQNLVIGAASTLTETLEIFRTFSHDNDFQYLEKLYEHLELVAHIPVRNIGTLGGNLMIKYEHHEFQSDVYLLLETVGAQLTILHPHNIRSVVTMQNFLKLSMKGAVIVNVLLPPLNSQHKIETFKIMPKAENAHAIVNAGFNYKLDCHGTVEDARIVYGGLSPMFTRAMKTESCLIGKTLFSNKTLQMAIEVLKRELIVTEMPPEPSVEYRAHLAINLFYKGLLSLCPYDKMDKHYASGGIKLKQSRPVSEARQIYDTDPSLWPLNKPIPKVEALIQCSGEAKYVEDIPSLPREVFAAFVLTTVAKGNITAIDPNKALACPGVIAFYSAKDIPGLNSFTPAGFDPLYVSDEEIFCDIEVKYYNQPLGMVVATSRQIAERAAQLVAVHYTNVNIPVLDIKYAKHDPSRNSLYFTAEASNRELLVCVTKPIEDGIQVFPASQWIDTIQVMISRALNIPQNKIDVEVRRIGGAYGCKLSRITQLAVACALATSKLNVPCRFLMPMRTNMRAVGKRLPNSTDYEIGVNSLGAVQYLNMTMYSDNGYILDELLSMLARNNYYNCYDRSKLNYKLYNSITDTPSNTWCRGPTTLENVAVPEMLMERIAYALSLDPISVRLQNIDNQKYPEILELLKTLKEKSEYDARKNHTEAFNKENRWKKRGLRTAFLKWTLGEVTYYDVNLSCYHGDGTVAITHAGIEMGQGVNTKAIQIAAYILKIPISKIVIKPNDTMIAPNSYISAGSFTSQYVGIGVQRCCEELLRRLKPIRTQLQNPTWEELITSAFNAGVDLQTHWFVGPNDRANYDIFGVTMAEVEIDVLTGESEILRVDLIQDVGLSTNPEIDIGQIEGAFTMGIGYWTTEHLVYNESTGELYTDRTWNYYVPHGRDIPQDLRVYFRKKSYGLPLVLGAKTTGEPSICMAVAIPLALREAITQARFDTGISKTQWFQIDGPYTVEKICLGCQNNSRDYKFY